MTLRELIENAGEWVHNSNIDEAVRDWERTRFTIEQVQAWINVGCTSGWAAQLLSREGITPEQASALVPETKETVAYAFSEGDLEIDDVKRILGLKRTVWLVFDRSVTLGVSGPYSSRQEAEGALFGNLPANRPSLHSIEPWDEDEARKEFPTLFE